MVTAHRQSTLGDQSFYLVQNPIRIGAVPHQIAQKHKLSREQKLEVLAAENVKLQIKHLQSLALIKNMHEKGSLPRIHGWLYRVETGVIDVLVNGRTGKMTKGLKALES